MQLQGPLFLEPLYFSYVWGAPLEQSWLISRFGRQTPPGIDRIAESWEVVGLDAELSNKLLSIQEPVLTLYDVLVQDPQAIFGSSDSPTKFPIIVKYLDIFERLSVQVHPDDATAERLGFGPFGKSEIWIVLEADPAARIWAGFANPVSRAIVEEAITSGELVGLLQEYTPRPGDCYFFPPGTVHAAQGHLLVAEVQDASQLTFRIFDWNRIGPGGQPRPLHIAQALEAIDYRQGPIRRVRVFDGERRAGALRLASCPKFLVIHWRIESPITLTSEGRFLVISLLEGELKVRGTSFDMRVGAGQTFLIPASLSSVNFIPLSRTPPAFLEIRPH
jgi:mannose-6-phosphate isomerase